MTPNAEYADSPQGRNVGGSESQVAPSLLPDEERSGPPASPTADSVGHSITIRYHGGSLAETGTVRCSCGWSERANVEYLDAMADQHLSHIGSYETGP